MVCYGGICVRPSGVTDRLEFGLCQALTRESEQSPHRLIHRLFHNHWGCKRVDLLWGVWVSEASHTTKEELS